MAARQKVILLNGCFGFFYAHVFENTHLVVYPHRTLERQSTRSTSLSIMQTSIGLVGLLPVSVSNELIYELS